MKIGNFEVEFDKRFFKGFWSWPLILISCLVISTPLTLLWQWKLWVWVLLINSCLMFFSFPSDRRFSFAFAMGMTTIAVSFLGWMTYIAYEMIPWNIGQPPLASSHPWNLLFAILPILILIIALFMYNYVNFKSFLDINAFFQAPEFNYKTRELYLNKAGLRILSKKKKNRSKITVQFCELPQCQKILGYVARSFALWGIFTAPLLLPGMPKNWFQAFVIYTDLTLLGCIFGVVANVAWVSLIILLRFEKQNNLRVRLAWFPS